jgi:hypothetical protein
MFGHHDDNKEPQEDGGEPADAPIQSVQPDENVDTAQPTEQPAASDNDTPDSTVIQPDQSVSATPAAADDTAQPTDQSTQSADHPQSEPWQHPGTPLDSHKEQIVDVISPAGGFPKRPTYQYPQGVTPPIPTEASSVPDDPVNRELIDVKEHALEELAPLLDKLDLPPEEKFRAIMMILQADDDKSLLKAAYDAAHAIEDEEIRAQALYTIVNEVDYFTHQDSTPH